MKIIIEMNLDDEYSDPNHSTGLTENGYDMLVDMLSRMGENIDVKKDE